MMMRIIHSLCVLAVAGALVYDTGSALAQGSDAERQACAPDAMRLCGDAIPDVAKVTACMKAKYSQLSEPCRIVMRGGKAAKRGEKKGETHYHHYYYYKHHCRHCG
jgi:hypothetical protein